MVVPMLEYLLGWTELETSLFFCGAGVEVSRTTMRTFKAHSFLCIKLIFSFILLLFLSKKITDR